MTDADLPEVTVGAAVAELIRQACGPPGFLFDLEADLGDTGDLPESLGASDAWCSFAEAVSALWRTRDYVVVRGMPALADGASLFLASLGLKGRFRRYRGSSIVKTFRMSPWTTDLSHTLADGEFHTDLNTDPNPPPVTCIQCVTPDPGAPRYGINRVARAADLLACLAASGNEDLLRFLCETRVTMVNDHSDSAWTGTIVDGERIRFHPETLRAASRRYKHVDPETESNLAALHEAAVEVSTPFWLDTGDILFLSNHRTLHYRGECSVIFVEFPLEFLSRSIHLLHKVDEPQ
ncbi:MAG TPA: TauD/TfdA family dioxygenase [Acidimicrobiales bacterium]|jgi:hypothetical protein|nr:TauD/TfdA family dioxygenase [Acidimicrobiales bacterium]